MIEARFAAVLALLAHATEVARGLGAASGVALALAGLAALLVSERLRRPSAVVGGAAVGALAGLAASALLRVELPVSPAAAGGIAAVLGGAAGGLWPAAFPALAGALVGGLAGVQLRGLLGGAVGAAVGAALGVVLARGVAVVLVAAAGGLATVLGALALAGGRPLAAELARHPAAVAGLAIVLAISGAAYQLSRAPAAARPKPGGAPKAQRLRTDDA